MNNQSGNFNQLLLALIIFFSPLLIHGQADQLAYEEGSASYRIVGVSNDAEETKNLSNTATLIKSTTVYFPNAFSPDHDGVNDFFGVVGMNAEKYTLKVYNKWGELLFATNNTNEKWDGTHKGKAVSEGVYVYTMSAKEKFSGKQISRSGTVTLLL